MENDSDYGSNLTAEEDCAGKETIVQNVRKEAKGACENIFLRLANLRDAWLVAYNSKRSNLRESPAQ